MIKLRVNPNINFKEIDKESIILSKEKAMIYSLNQTATVIMKFLQRTEQSTSENIVSHLLKKYEVSEQNLRKDVEEMLKKFIELSFVIVC